MPGLEALPRDVAGILAASTYFGITLPPALEPEPAAALAGHNGPLIVPGPRPPRKSLQLVPEPDGSRDDFPSP